MSRILKINEVSYFATLLVRKDELKLAVTDFGKGFHGSIPMSEALALAKVNFSNSKHIRTISTYVFAHFSFSLQSNNPHMSLPEEEILKLLKAPSDIAAFVESAHEEEVVLQFKYPIEQFFFKVNWKLKKMTEVEFKQALIMPAFDALVRMQKSINRFNILSRQNPEDLERLPVYSPFDIKSLLMNLNTLDLMSEICKNQVTIQSLPTPRKVLLSPRKNKGGVKRKCSVRQQLVREVQLNSRIASQELHQNSDSDSNEEPPVPKNQSLVVNRAKAPIVARPAKRTLKL